VYILDPLTSGKLLELKVEIKNAIRYAEVLLFGIKIFPLWGIQGVQRPLI